MRAFIQDLADGYNIIQTTLVSPFREDSILIPVMVHANREATLAGVARPEDGPVTTGELTEEEFTRFAQFRARNISKQIEVDNPFARTWIYTSSIFSIVL